MKNQFAVNRVEMELNQWRSREDRFSKLFSFSLSSNRALLKEKLHHYERVAARYKGTKDLDERFTLKVLEQERRRMEKQLYPNLLIRMLRRLLVLPQIEQAAIRRDLRNTIENSRSLQEQLQKAGFSGLTSRLEEQIRQGQSQFTIPVSYYVSQKERMDHQLTFSKDPTGRYQFSGFQAKLHDETRPDAARQHYFELRDGMDVNRAYHLLQGRAIQKEDRWLQLDFNDKDAQGNYRVKEFHSTFGYDLEKVLQSLPIKELHDSTTSYQLLDKLRQGSRQEVSFLRGDREQRYYIEANPQFKSINIYDEHSRKITLSTALGNKTTQALKISHKVNEQQVRAKRNGMKMH